jgi:hypothetical protein
MQDKWHIKNKKGYLKITYIAVNVKTKKILSMKVTDDKYVHDDIKVLPELVNDIIKLDKKITIGELFADDGAYEDNDIFRCLENNEYAMH